MLNNGDIVFLKELVEEDLKKIYKLKLELTEKELINEEFEGYIQIRVSLIKKLITMYNKNLGK